MLQRLTALRTLMASQQPTALAAYIIPTADAHGSEYISPVDARREWISGFTGSAGTAVVTPSQALMWTDGRYFTQFEQEADLTLWTLMKQTLPDTPSIEKWLSQHLKEGSVVGVDPFTMSRDSWTPLENTLKESNIRLLPIKCNLVDQARAQLKGHQQTRKFNEIIHLPVKYSGKRAGDKIQELRDKMEHMKAAALVITALDEIAYTLNLRGSDIEYNPVFYSYLVITKDCVTLFWSDGTLCPPVTEELSSEGVTVQCLPYDSITNWLVDHAKKLSKQERLAKIWLSNDASEAIHRAASGADVLEKPLMLISEVSPVALAKLVKNEVELEGFRQCHIRDGIAVVRFLNWLHSELDSGKTYTEVQAADKLLEFRKDEKNFMGASFETIAGFGSHAAIIHYSPSRDGPQREINTKDIFLLDSGGQYKDGTTDITRTRHMGRAPTEEQKVTFTKVLKGQIAVGSTLFPKGVRGNVLDSFARRALWDVGLDYGHGTGHGVGHFLNVHEGPSVISFKPNHKDPGLKPGQILSNEPGYYKVDHYGIRHEDLVEIIAVDKNTDHPKAKNLVGDFLGRGVLGFRTLTMVPHQKECIDISLLDDFELCYINSYHQRVLDTLGPILEARKLDADLAWLKNECAPIVRA